MGSTLYAYTFVSSVWTWFRCSYTRSCRGSLPLFSLLSNTSSSCYSLPHPPSSLPSPVHPGSGGAPPIVHSPRSTRDYDMPGATSVPHHPTHESMMLSSSSGKPPPPPRERDHWSQRGVDTSIHHSPSMQDYRDRDKDLRRPYFHRLPSRLAPVDDRPLSSPFVMAPAPTSSLSTSLLLCFVS